MCGICGQINLDAGQPVDRHIIDAMVTVLGKPDRITAFNRRSYPDKDSFADNQLAVFGDDITRQTIGINGGMDVS